ncbi:MAG: hypothetical protein AMXMBFR46_22330 [Acidimicrobiia bacterium]
MTEVGSVITVSGALDARDVADLRAAVIAALAHAPAVEVDLRSVNAMSPDAVSALAECARIGQGIVFRFRGGCPDRGIRSAR